MVGCGVTWAAGNLVLAGVIVGDRGGSEGVSGLMSLAEVSRYLGMSERTIYGWAQEGKIPAFKLGSAWRFRRSEVDEWLEARRSGGVSKRPITPDVDLEPTSWRVRELDEEERAALVKSCKNAIDDMLTDPGRTVLPVDGLIEDFGVDAVREAVESLRKEKRIIVSDVKDRDGQKVKIIERTDGGGW